MALKECKECGMEVSTKAKICPHCGKRYPTGGFTWPAKILLIFVLLLVLGKFVGHSKQSLKPAIKTDYESSQQEPNVLAETKEDDLETRIAKKLGISNISNQPRVNKILYQKDLNTLLILITVNDNLTKNLIEHGWWNDAWQVLQMAYDDPKVQSDVMVQGFYPITDAYGNTKWRTIAAIMLPRSEYQKINRKNFIPKDLIKIGVGQFDINGID